MTKIDSENKNHLCLPIPSLNEIDWFERIGIESLQDKMFYYAMLEPEKFWEYVRKARVEYARSMSKSLREVVGKMLADKIAPGEKNFKIKLFLEIPEDKVPFNSPENYIDSAEELMENSETIYSFYTTKNLIVPDVEIMPQLSNPNHRNTLFGISPFISLYRLKLVELEVFGTRKLFFTETIERDIRITLNSMTDHDVLNLYFSMLPESGEFEALGYDGIRKTIIIEENMTAREVSVLLRYNGICEHSLKSLDELFPGYGV